MLLRRRLGHLANAGKCKSITFTSEGLLQSTTNLPCPARMRKCVCPATRHACETPNCDRRQRWHGAGQQQQDTVAQSAGQQQRRVPPHGCAEYGFGDGNRRCGGQHRRGTGTHDLADQCAQHRGPQQTGLRQPPFECDRWSGAACTRRGPPQREAVRWFTVDSMLGSWRAPLGRSYPENERPLKGMQAVACGAGISAQRRTRHEIAYLPARIESHLAGAR